MLSSHSGEHTQRSELSPRIHIYHHPSPLLFHIYYSPLTRSRSRILIFILLLRLLQMLLQLLLLVRKPICILLHPLQVHFIGNRGVIGDRDTLLYSRAGIDSFPPFVQVGEFFEIDAGEVGYVDPAV